MDAADPRDLAKRDWSNQVGEHISYIYTLSIRMYMMILHMYTYVYIIYSFIDSTGYVWWDYHGINQPWYRISSIRIM